MTEVSLPSSIRRVFKLAMVFTLIGTLTLVIMGHATLKIHEDVKGLRAFLELASDIQPNFEQSLMLYTESTAKIIEFLLELRPDTEVEYITAIAEIESISEALSLNIDLESIPAEESKASILRYELEFFGTKDQLIAFLKELERLPYFIAVHTLEFKEWSSDTEKRFPNIRLTLDLHVQ